MQDEEVAGVSVVVRDGERFLLVRRGRPPARGQYAFPGGRVEAGESEEEAARRELLEETGLAAETLAPVCTIEIDGDNGRRYRLKVFQALEVHGTALAGDDADQADWFTLETIRALPATASTLALAEEIAVRARDAIPLHGAPSAAKRER